MFQNKRVMARLSRGIIVILMALFPIAGHALALGKLKVLSALNEPLNAVIEFTSITEKELKGLTVSLASRADFDVAGVDRPPFLSQIKFIVAKKLDGRYFLELRTEQQLNEPFLHLLLQIDWPGGRLVREYTALIDPPYKIAGKAAPVEAPQITPPAPMESPPTPSPPPMEAVAPPAEIIKEELPPVIAKPEELKPEAVPTQEEPVKETVTPESPALAKEATPEEPFTPKVEPLEAAPKAEIESPPVEQPVATPETKPESAPVLAAISEYDVKRGDTLWRIAERARADNADLSIEQMILAIYRTNKDAFFGNNVNNLKAGKILKIPEREEVASVTSRDAHREFRAQYSAWQEYKLKLASASQAVKVTEAPETVPTAAPEAPVMSTETKPAQAKPAETTPAATDKKKQEELLKIVRNTLQQEKSTPDKKVAEKESARDATAREQQALAERTATLEESLESKRLENKDLSEKVGMVRSQLQKESRLIELENQNLAQQQQKALAPKPAEPAKPVEQPVAPKVETQPKAESLPPVAKPQPVKPAAPKKRPPPPPAPVEEKGFLASVLEAVQGDLLMPVVIGLVVLLTGGIALVYFRRRQQSIAEFEESILSGEAISTDQTGDSHTQGAVTTGGDTSFLSDFSQGGMGNIHTDEVDPVAEAEVYLAYGRDETAEDILKEAVVKHPERHELKLKLLEIYHQRNDVPAFETLAEELYAALGGRGGKIWDKVEQLGRKLNPENPMFRGGAPAGAPTAAPAAKPAAPAAVGLASSAEADKHAGVSLPGDATAKPDSAGDFDFEIDTPSKAPSAMPDDFAAAMPKEPPKEETVSSLDSIDLGTPVDDSVEFDAGEKADAAADLEFETPSEAAPADQDVKWEPEPEQEPARAAAPEADNQVSSQWDETATKLDLAKAYIDMGDSEGARSILQEVMTEGNDTQKKQAQELSAQLA